MNRFERVSASIRCASGAPSFSCAGFGVAAGSSRQRNAELAAQVAGAEEERLHGRQRRARLRLVLRRRRRRQQRDDHVDVRAVAERVERELERLAPEQQVALLGRRAAGDRAVRPEPVERVHHALAVEQLDVAAGRRGAHRDVERPAVELERLGVDGDELVGVAEPVLRADVLGDLLRRAGVVVGGRLPRRPAARRAVGVAAVAASMTPRPIASSATPMSAPRTKPKRGR